jgi:hypothetical protein
LDRPSGQKIDQRPYRVVAEPAVDVPSAPFDPKQSRSPELLHVMGHGSPGDPQILAHIANALFNFVVKGTGCSRRTIREQPQEDGQTMRVGECLEYFRESLKLM